MQQCVVRLVADCGPSGSGNAQKPGEIFIPFPLAMRQPNVRANKAQ